MLSIGERAVLEAVGEALAGAREIGGNNQGPFVDKYLNAPHPGQVTHRGEPWCCAFYCWCVLEAADALGTAAPLRYTRSCSALWEGFTARNQSWLVRDCCFKETKSCIPPLKPGDAVFWDWTGKGAPQHVNLVHHVDADGVLYTIGGNEGDAESGAPVQVKRRGPLTAVLPTRTAPLHGLFGFGLLALTGESRTL